MLEIFFTEPLFNTCYIFNINLIYSVQFIHSVMSNSLQPHGWQHTRLPHRSPTSEACLNSHPSSWWCHPNIWTSVVPFSSCLPSFPASGSFPRSQFFASGSQSIGASASATVLPMNIQDWFPLGWTGWILLLSKELSRVFSNTTVWKHQLFCAQLSLWFNSHIHTWLLKKTQLCLYGCFLVMWCLCFSICCLGFSLLFFPKKQESFNFMAAVTICSDFGAPPK